MKHQQEMKLIVMLTNYLKTLLIVSLLSTKLFSCGCLDPQNQPIKTNEGKNNYDKNDNNMLNEFKDIANKMKNYYQNFENKSSKLIEDSAKIQYLEDVIASEIVFELQRANNLKDIEIDSTSTKVLKNSKSSIK